MIEAIFLHPWVWILPIVIALSLASLAAGIGFAVRYRDRFDSAWQFFSPVLIIFGAIGTVAAAGVYFAVLMPPYDMSFHYTYQIKGEVTEIRSAMSGDEGTMSQTFTARIDGIDYYIQSNDQRFRNIDEGDNVNLVCSKQFRYFQEPWYDCSIGGMNS